MGQNGPEECARIEIIFSRRRSEKINSTLSTCFEARNRIFLIRIAFLLRPPSIRVALNDLWFELVLKRDGGTLRNKNLTLTRRPCRLRLPIYLHEILMTPSIPFNFQGMYELHPFKDRNRTLCAILYSSHSILLTRSPILVRDHTRANSLRYVRANK